MQVHNPVSMVNKKYALLHSPLVPVTLPMHICLSATLGVPCNLCATVKPKTKVSLHRQVTGQGIWPLYR